MQEEEPRARPGQPGYLRPAERAHALSRGIGLSAGVTHWGRLAGLLEAGRLVRATALPIGLGIAYDQATGRWVISDPSGWSAQYDGRAAARVLQGLGLPVGPWSRVEAALRARASLQLARPGASLSPGPGAGPENNGQGG